MKSALCVIGFVVAGCGLQLQDPCAGVKGSCLALQIEPSTAVQKVDQVVVSVISGAGTAASTADDGRRLSLPLGVAVIFDAAPPAGTLTAGVAAIFDGHAFASTPQSFTLASGEHRTLYVTLHATTDGSGGLDGSVAADLESPAPPDMAGSDLLCAPITVCPTTVGCGTISDQCGGILLCGGVCQLNAIAPTTANTGAIVTLEGTFGATATVNFPGGVQVPASVLGAHRAQVVVPDGATAGDLTVTTDTSTLGPLPFHHALYKLGLGPFALNLDQASGGKLSYGWFIEGGTSVTVGQRVYILGGLSGRNYFLPAISSTINADGSLAGLVRDPGVTMTTPRYSHTSVRIGNFVYVIGGVDTTGAQLASVESSTVAADDTISAFAPVPGVTLKRGRSQQMSVVIGDYLYEIGGFGGGPLDDIERAVINPDGTLSPFAAVDGITLTTPRGAASAVIRGDRLYVIGGVDVEPLTTVESAPIGADGSLGAFTVVDNVTLTTGRSAHGTLVIGDSVYVIGGTYSTGTELASIGTGLASVERASFTGDTLGGFAVVDELALADPLANAQFTVVGDHLFVIGGLFSSGWDSSVENASLDDSGDLSNFNIVDGVTLTTPRCGHSSFVVGNHLYVIGGSPSVGGTPRGDVEDATILPDGSLTTFAPVPGVTLVTPRALHTTFSGAGVVYVAGGESSGSQLTSVESATLNDDGTFASSFAIVDGVSLTAPTSGAAGINVGGADLVIGSALGLSGSVVSNVVQQGGFSSDGASTFSNLASTLVQARGNFATAVLGDQLYVIGGLANGYLSSVEVATVNPIISAFTTAPVSLTASRSQHTGFVLGRSLYVAGGRNGTLNGSLPSLEKSAIDPTGTLGAFAAVPSAFNTARLQHTSNVIGDYVYVVGGAPGYGASALGTVERAARK